MRSYSILLITIGLAQLVLSHTCTHKQNYKPSYQQESEDNHNKDSNTRILQDASFRITYDTTVIDQQVQNQDQLKLIYKTLEVAKLFYTNLMIPKNPTKTKIQPSQNDPCIDDYPFTQEQLDNGVESDFHFFIQGVTNNISNESIESTDNNDWIAASSACKIQQSDNRTIMGIITINLNHLKTMTTSNYDFQNYVDVFIHEMFHSLIFSPTLFGFFIKPTGGSYTDGVDYKIDSSTKQYFVKFPNCIQWAKDHYGCDKITEIPLENSGSEGSYGSHWERTILENDIMTASSQPDDAYWSGLNNALILDSGWYTLRTDSSPFQLEDKMMWGKGRGCDFFDYRCKNQKYPEFCTGTQNMNTFSYSGLGYCSSGDKYSECSYARPYKNQVCVNENNKFDINLGAPLYGRYFAIFDATTRSFQSDLSPDYLEKLENNFAVCYPFTCNANQKQVNIKVGNTDIICDSDNKVISNVKGFNGSLTCPASIEEFCEGIQSCPNFCGQRGYCIQGKCRCVSGITGLDQNSCECQTGYFVNEQNTCVSCNVNNCKTCQEVGKCSQCNLGYYNLDGQCTKCDANCSDCDANGKCLKCDFGYVKFDNKSLCQSIENHTSALINKAIYLLGIILIIMFY